jgi:hypothetical protein
LQHRKGEAFLTWVLALVAIGIIAYTVVQLLET